MKVVFLLSQVVLVILEVSFSRLETALHSGVLRTTTPFTAVNVTALWITELAMFGTIQTLSSTFMAIKNVACPFVASGIDYLSI